MFIKVDLPAPFSPTMPWIEPLATRRVTSWLAWTGPNHLSMPMASIAHRPPCGGTMELSSASAAVTYFAATSVTLILPAMMSALAASSFAFMSAVISFSLLASRA